MYNKNPAEVATQVMLRITVGVTKIVPSSKKGSKLNF
jgi:hypothetical protein